MVIVLGTEATMTGCLAQVSKNLLAAVQVAPNHGVAALLRLDRPQIRHKRL
jgi:hypothetical protein